MLRHILVVFILLFSFQILATEGGVIGKVLSSPGCAKKVMVWLSLDEEDYQKRLLLMHTEVPVGGKFQFYLKAGNYQLRATDEKGCESFQKIRISNTETDAVVRMKK